MTTIAYKDGIMVGDGRVTTGSTIDTENFVKVYNIDGVLVGGAGRACSIIKFVGWLSSFLQSSSLQQMVDPSLVNVVIPEQIEDDDFVAMVKFPEEQTITIFEGGKGTMELDVPYYSIGSGSDFALASMDLGATAEEAVKVAMKRDAFSGGEITVVTFEDTDEFLGIPSDEVLNKMTKQELIKFIKHEEDDEAKEVKEEKKPKAPKAKKSKPNVEES